MVKFDLFSSAVLFSLLLSVILVSAVEVYVSQGTISFLSPTPTAGVFLNVNYTSINITTNLTGFTNITVYLINSTVKVYAIANSTDPTFSANFSGLIDGIWYLNASSGNSSNFKNVTVLQNFTIDTRPPSIINGTNTESNNTIIPRNNIFINVSVGDVNFANLSVRLYNSTVYLVNTTFSTVSNFSINLTNLSDSDGLYFFDFFACDLANNCNYSQLRQVILNATFPYVNSAFSESVGTSTSLITFNSSKFVNATISYGKTTALDLSIVNTTLSQVMSFQLSSLTNSTTYYYNITLCDRANNCVTNGTRSFVTATPPADDSSSGGGSSEITVLQFWLSTYGVSDQSFTDGFNKQLYAKNRLQFKVNSETHYLGLISLSSNSATINLSSDPQQGRN